MGGNKLNFCSLVIAIVFSLKSKKLYIGIIAASGSSRVKTLKRFPRVIYPTSEIKPHQNVLVSNLKKKMKKTFWVCLVCIWEMSFRKKFQKNCLVWVFLKKFPKLLSLSYISINHFFSLLSHSQSLILSHTSTQILPKYQIISNSQKNNSSKIYNQKTKTLNHTTQI